MPNSPYASKRPPFDEALWADYERANRAAARQYADMPTADPTVPYDIAIDKAAEAGAFTFADVRRHLTGDWPNPRTAAVHLGRMAQRGILVAEGEPRSRVFRFAEPQP